MRNKLAIVAFGGNAMLAAEGKGTAREAAVDLYIILTGVDRGCENFGGENDSLRRPVPAGFDGAENQSGDRLHPTGGGKKC